MKPLDSSEGVADVGGFDVERGAAVRNLAAGSEIGGQDPDGGEEGGVGSEPPAGTPHRVSQVVPRGTAEDEEAREEGESPRHSDIAPRPGVLAARSDLDAPESDATAAAAELDPAAAEPEVSPSATDAQTAAGSALDTPATFERSASEVAAFEAALAAVALEARAAEESDAEAGAVEAGAVEAGASQTVEAVVAPAPLEAAADETSPAPQQAPLAPRYAMRALRGEDLGTTLMGPTFGPDEDDEATMVDAAAALSEADRALMARAPSNMAETLLVGTPLPAPAQPAVSERAPVVDPRHLFKQTMLLGLPRLEPPAAAAASPASAAAPVASAAAPSDSSAAVLASVVRVVGPPTQPPPRRARRPGSSETAGGLAADGADLDHEAFVLSNPIGAEPGRRSSVPAPPPTAAGTEPASSSLSSLLPPHPARAEAPSAPAAAPPGAGGMSARALSPAAVAAGAAVGSASMRSLPPGSLPAGAAVGSASVRSLPPGSLPAGAAVGSASVRSLSSAAGVGSTSARSLATSSGDLLSQRSSYPPPLRATIEPPQALARTRPPMSRNSLPPALMDELPATDPFAGFVAPAPSAAQRWLVVIVVALAVVGLCSLAAIAFGLLGKTGW